MVRRERRGGGREEKRGGGRSRIWCGLGGDSRGKRYVAMCEEGERGGVGGEGAEDSGRMGEGGVIVGE